jgi:hypothetical protein
MTKYTAALRHRTADPEAILRRFAGTTIQHPTYTALAELGKVLKTIFLCSYIGSEVVRREIHAGLNVVENWNGSLGFIFFGKGGEMASNRLEDQEISILGAASHSKLSGLRQYLDAAAGAGGSGLARPADAGGSSRVNACNSQPHQPLWPSRCRYEPAHRLRTEIGSITIRR